jgi:hypothetical protein
MAENEAEIRDISDETVKQNTGRKWQQWIDKLDDWGMVTISGHDMTVKFLIAQYQLSPWWAEAVTVRYEWERGIKK